MNRRDFFKTSANHVAVAAAAVWLSSEMLESVAVPPPPLPEPVDWMVRTPGFDYTLQQYDQLRRVQAEMNDVMGIHKVSLGKRPVVYGVTP